MQLLILGREKNLCLAEAESLFKQQRLICEDAIAVEAEQPIDIDSLGGSVKVARIFQNNSKSIQSDITKHILDLHKQGKINFGLSFYGKVRGNKAIGITIKNKLKQQGLSVRHVRNDKESALNAATVIHNKLLTKGYEILVVQGEDGKVVLAQTTGVQDIDSYSKRDYDKPCRNKKVGMLPPKLSQIMINLSRPSADTTIVDPFCGSAGIMFEAALFGLRSEGSDLSDEMTKCSEKNIDWLIHNYKLKHVPVIGAAADATTRDYGFSRYNIVSEGYLGENFISRPSVGRIKEQIPQLQVLYLEFLSHLTKQPKRPGSIVLSIPFWNIEGRKFFLNIIDEISKMGYNIHEFQSVKSRELLYYREGQFTGRQILVLN